MNCESFQWDLWPRYLVDQLFKISSGAFIAQFNYNSISDSVYIFIEKAEDLIFIIMDAESNQIEWGRYDGLQKKGSFKFLMKCCLVGKN